MSAINRFPWLIGLSVSAASFLTLHFVTLPEEFDQFHVIRDMLLSLWFAGLVLAVGGVPRRHTNTTGTTLSVLALSASLAVAGVQLADTLTASNDITAIREMHALAGRETRALYPRIVVLTDPAEKAQTLAFYRNVLNERRVQLDEDIRRRRREAAESGVATLAAVVVALLFAAEAWFLVRLRKRTLVP